ncbi:MAG TPA: zinc-binding dehydrogenase [Chthonomonadaceae bacterium]|nr:zinc-binding dehydrogenase [Chthonomonadaceae bacterium]
MQAHAAVAVAPRRVVYQAISVPDPGPDEIVVRVTHSWISNGTEGSFVRGERIGGDTPRQESDPLPFPHVPGYQKVGVVDWIGAHVTDVRIGDVVFATVSRVEGMFYAHGGHVSPAVTHRTQVWKLPEGLDPVSVSGMVLTQVGYNVGTRPTVRSGDAIVVIGDGMVGHWAAQTFQHRDARVLMLGRHDERLGLLGLHAGDRIVNANREDPLEAIRAWASEGIQALADTVGTVPTLEMLLPIMRRDSHISSAGFYGPHGLIDIQKLRNHEITLHAPSGWTTPRMNATLELLAQGALTTSHLITHRFPASQAGDAFDLILNRREPVLGVILEWE